MYFQLNKIVLWPKGEQPYREVKFEPGQLNIISGASKTGKSAVIPIVDYCLAAEKCAIPVGVIRDSCSWFGIVISTVEGQKLLARREPGEQRQTSDMFVLEGDEVTVPERILERNSNSSDVKGLLDRVAALPQLGFHPDSDAAYRSRPSFRDLMAFVFQPQNIVANPNVLFFKADTTEHREKLKTIFPYVLNAVTAEILAARWEVAELKRVLRRKERELQATRATVEVWRREADAWLQQAVELGLYPVGEGLPVEWVDVIEVLRAVTRSTSRAAKPTVEAVDTTLERLEELRDQEGEAAAKLSNERQRYNEIRRLLQSSAAYGSALRVQRDRLQLSQWIRSRLEEDEDPLGALSAQGRQDVEELCLALEAIELRIRSHPAMSDTLDKERIRLSSEVERRIGELSQVRRQIAALERESDEAREEVYRADRVDRFLGRLEQALILYDKADENAELSEEIAVLESRIGDLRSAMSDGDIERRIENALRTVEGHASEILPKLDAEWPEAPIQLVVEELTLKIVQGVRDDFLWEIGSAANWLAYHVAATLALQRFFLSQPHHPTPGLLVYDQPSQAYFPGRDRRSGEEDDPEWRDEDVVAVRRAFRAIAEELTMSKGRLQAIVLDHANEDVWGDIDNTYLVENWRGGAKLVPDSWL